MGFTASLFGIYSLVRRLNSIDPFHVNSNVSLHAEAGACGARGAEVYPGESVICKVCAKSRQKPH